MFVLIFSCHFGFMDGVCFDICGDIWKNSFGVNRRCSINETRWQQLLNIGFIPLPRINFDIKEHEKNFIIGLRYVRPDGSCFQPKCAT